MSDAHRDNVARLEGIKKHIAYDFKFASHQPLSLAEASVKLRAEESTTKSVHPISGKDIQTDVCRIASLSPVEDEFSHGEIEVKEGEKWLYWGVFDGHSGWATAKVLSSIIARRVARHLGTLTDESIRDVESVMSAFESAFLELDDEITSDGIDAMSDDIPHAEAMCRIAPTSSGSCASLVFLDPVSSMLYAACSGDSRVVMGQSNKPGAGWTAVALSKDQTGSNPDEVSRINAEHPGETPIKGGCVLGYFKDDYLTPPYITAKPAMQSLNLVPGSFLIIASDGFWNHMASDDDAVYCMETWLEDQKKEDMRGSDCTATEGEIPKSSGSTGYAYNWNVPREKFVVENENAATHLVRNAFGGSNTDLFCGMMSLKSPDSKQARDDTTVIVVFF
ncbi:uncharacterized protein N7506_006881 [Penicillium brevicompactum]|uniref:uncharacterized protein n=1 Tax=Penicillium brevicompactum TaxID=5074 RepID=UPI002540873F|nr:uncharacterized protein N7506_006881 [Penicillium brevicompactum]KAJ5333098.1 hypothetical protein N7506_006881 [Penicillium brevicompactum]